MDNKKLVITDKCDIEIPKAGMVIKFDGETVQLGFVTNTEMVVDGDLKIGTTGNFEVISKKDVVLGHGSVGALHLGDIDKINKVRYGN